MKTNLNKFNCFENQMILKKKIFGSKKTTNPKQESQNRPMSDDEEPLL
jgi:hypothetical protein